MSDHETAVPVDTIVHLCKLYGSDAALDNGKLFLYPRGGEPKVYVISDGIVKRRLVIQIGVLTGIPSHVFWNPERAAPPAEVRARQGSA